MDITKTLLLAFFAAALIGAAPLVADAQDTDNRTIEQFTCKDVMREETTTRDATIAFLDGFLLGKSGQSSFSVDALTKQTDAFIDHCLDHPTDKAIDALMKVKM